MSVNTGLFASLVPLQDVLHAAGSQASHILTLWWFVVAVCTTVFVCILVALFYALYKTPRSTRSTAPIIHPGTGTELSNRRGVLWATSISSVLLLVLIMASVLTDRALAHLPLDGAIAIEVTAHQYWWEARYGDPQGPNSFTTANELHIPVGVPVTVTLRSSDVIHSFWVPSLQGKKDLIPGRTATLELRADRAGIFRGQCAEFCGLQHANMAFLVIAEPLTRYQQWSEHQRAAAAAPATVEQNIGREVFMSATCPRCHAIAGTPAGGRIGPDLTHLTGRQTIAAGMLPNTRGHLAGWVVDPQQIKPGNSMPTSALSAGDLKALLSYLETLQ